MIKTWIGDYFHMGEQSAVLQRLNKLCRAIGVGEAGNDDPIVTKPTLTPNEFADKIERLIERTREGQGECLTMPQLLP